MAWKPLGAYLLNLTDLAFTLYALCHGGVEMNPLMQSIPIMVIFKVVIVGVLCWWLSKRNEPLARFGLNLCTAVYAVLFVYHCVGLFYLKG